MIHTVSQQSVQLALLMKLAILIFFVAAVLLVFKFVFKLKWPTAICVAVLSASILIVVGGRGIGGIGYNIFGYNILKYILLLGAVCAIVLLILFFRWLFMEAFSQSSVNPAERNRILKMVEEGKISADEGKELLDAMGKSSALRGEEKFTRVDIVILAGVGLVVLGFFLPWVYLRMSQMPGPFGNISGYQAGYHTGAIGWTIFITAIASAIPVFVTPRNFLYKISMLQIFLTLIGLILVISVMVPAADHSDLGAGLFFCLAGFIAALFASVAKLRSLAA